MFGDARILSRVVKPFHLIDGAGEGADQIIVLVFLGIGENDRLAAAKGNAAKGVLESHAAGKPLYVLKAGFEIGVAIDPAAAAAGPSVAS